MYKSFKNILAYTLLVIIVFISIDINACTTAVISGKYTKDGRPLLWKNRDTWAIKNYLRYFEDGKYSYMGLVNSKDIEGKSIWIGMNSEGFAIMNSASYNLNIGDTTKQSGFDGRFMKKVLQECATLEDFEALLNSMEKPTRLEANFGVIDANGGAAYYELSNKDFVKFDANDPTVAPFGYIIRTNYSHTGKLGIESSGYIRYNTANEMFYNAISTNIMDAQFIIQKATRTLYHSLIKEDLSEKYGNNLPNTPAFSHFIDFIPRTGSSSSVVIHGVIKDENPEHAVMWSVVGFPLTSIVVPIWIKNKDNFPEILKYNESIKDSPICNAALELKRKCLPIRWGLREQKYLNVNALYNSEGTGIKQIIQPYENKIFKKTSFLVENMRNNKVSAKIIDEHYKWLNGYIKDLFYKEFELKL